MEAENTKKQVSKGERLLHSMFRLLQVVKIHQSNNKLFAENVLSFKDALTDIWNEGRPANLSVYRGRFFLNDERIIYSPSMWATSIKIAEFFQERGFNGLKFAQNDSLTDADIVSLMDLLNRAKRDPKPFEWLSNEISTKAPWVSLSKDEDLKISSDAGSVQGRADGRAAVVRTTAPKEQLNTQARHTYSQALTVMRNIITRLTEGKRVGVQKPKRIIQELIDVMIDDESIFLALSTVRDLGDQILTHSVNVAILSIGIGRKINLSRSELEQLGLCGLFHDLGKLGKIGETASKSTKLTNEEISLVQSHVMESILHIISLNASYSLKYSLIQPAGEHHLGVNFCGYPKVEENTPVSLDGRIIAVADQYDALTSHRPWRETPATPHEALLTMMDQSGSQLDPLILKVFVNMLGPWPVGSLLILNTKELALAHSTPPASEEGLPLVQILYRQNNEALVKGPLVNLSDRDPKTGQYIRFITSSLHPITCGIQAADYLIA